MNYSNFDKLRLAIDSWRRSHAQDPVNNSTLVWMMVSPEVRSHLLAYLIEMENATFPTVELANGEDVQKYLVDALEAFDKKWPGATLPQARVAIANAVLNAFKAGPP